MMQLEEFRKKVDKNVLKDMKMSKEDFEKFLKDYADQATDFAGLFRDVVAHDERATSGGNHERREDSEGRCLAASIGTKQSENLSRSNIERDPRQRGPITVLMA